MSGVKKTGSGGKPAGGAPAVKQSTNMLSFFARAGGPAVKKEPTSPPTGASPAAAAPAVTAAGAPPTTGFGAAGGAAVAAGFFGTATTTGAPMKAASTTPRATPITSPKPAASAATAAPSAATGASDSGRKRKQINYGEDSGEEEETKTPAAKSAGKKKKTKRVSSDDDDEYDDAGAASAASADDADDSEDEPASDYDQEEKKTPAKPAAARASGGGGSSSKAAPVSSGKKKPASASKAASMDSDDEENRPAETDKDGKAYETPFLDPANRMDLNRVKPGQPGYDPTTLYISPAQFKGMTPAEAQYWEIKQLNMGQVLLFKIGKFYEMFDDDAAVGVKELDLSYMVNQKRPHAGFPEAALNKYSEKLVNLGYKVGVVDQTETPEMLAEANKNAGAKKRKAVKRELTSVLTPGTIVDAAVVGSHNAVYTLALTEKQLPAEEIAAMQSKFLEAEAQFLEAEKNGQTVDKAVLQKLSQGQQAVVEIGFAYVDCATGRFIVGQSKDDQQRSFLRTLLGFINPRELVLPRGQLTPETEHVLQHDCQADTIHNDLGSKDFWSADKTVQELNSAQYFTSKKAAAGASPMEDWPIALAEAVQQKETLLLSAFGAMTYYLRVTMHDRELLSQKHVQNYFHARGGGGGAGKQQLVLDGQTLANLEVVKSQKGTVKGTLLEFVDRTSSPFGKRRLREWLLQPLAHLQPLQDRQDAVEFFMTHPELAKRLSEQLKKLPDLERNLSRIHANGLIKKVEAIMYENVSLRQLELFIKTLKGFASAADIIRQFTAQVESDPDFRTGSRLSRLISSSEDGGLLPLFEPSLNKVRASFDAEKALEKGKIQPNPGTNEEYDDLVEQLNTARASLTKYMTSIQKELGDSSIKWMHQAKVRYQIEVPIKTVPRVPARGWELQSGTKTVKRYYTSESRRLAAELTKLELEQETMDKDSSRKVFADFAEDYQLWSGTVDVLAELDCLLSLAAVSSNHIGCVRPKFVSHEASGGNSFIDLRQAVHPALYESQMQKHMDTQPTSFIPNDTVIGTGDCPAKFVLVSGPNMGGKSTLLRQTCCAVILAQLGCWVPAASCTLTPIDRIFTRVGANDQIMSGDSTFLVELKETALILKHATDRSLVILDELGRGTSTFDGTAIAYAVIRYLCEVVGSLTFFATHYHLLMEEFKDSPLVDMYHMSLKENDDGSDVIFLYRFIRGVCPSSFGGKVAKAAGLPEEVLKLSGVMSKQLEARCVAAHQTARDSIFTAFPPQATTGGSLLLPPSTTATLDAALARSDLDTLIRYMRDFALSKNPEKMNSAPTKSSTLKGNMAQGERKVQQEDVVMSS